MVFTTPNRFPVAYFWLNSVVFAQGQINLLITQSAWFQFSKQNEGLKSLLAGYSEM